MDTVPCPGCRTELDPAAGMCPICLRPRGKLEIMRGYSALSAERERLRRRPFIIAKNVLIAAAAGGAVFFFRAEIAGAAAWARDRAAAFLEQIENPGGLAGRPAKNSPAAPMTPPAAPTPPPAPEAPESPIPPAPEAARPVKAALPKRSRIVYDLPIPPLDSASQWAAFGRVYDLRTLKPVENIRVDFKNQGYARGTAVSDQDGRYMLVLPRLSQGSFELAASDPRYAPDALYEADVPYRRLSAAERARLIHGAQSGDIPPASLSDPAGRDSLRRDVFVAPRR